MYSGVYEDLDPLETPINLFETDMSKVRKYRLMKLGNVFEPISKKGNAYISQLIIGTSPRHKGQ